MKRTVITLFVTIAFAVVSLVACGPKENGGEGNEELGPAFNTMGASNALFSVANGKQVRFSKGNLQHHPSFGAWRFADNQYDCMLDSNTFIAEGYKGWIDLFGWGTSGWNGGAIAYQPWAVDDVDTHYWVGSDWTNGLFGPGENGDWGMYNSIFGGGNQPGMWRTLKRDEWMYLLGNNDIRKNKCGFAVVADKHYGLVVLPDEWKLPEGLSFAATDGTDSNSTLNSYSTADWDKLEAAGAIFLPVASLRSGNQINVYNVDGMHRACYWTASYRDKMQAFALVFNYQGINSAQGNETIKSDLWGRHYGMSVRLVQDKK